MKKILLAVMAVAAISFTSCGNKTQPVTEEPVDSVAIIAQQAEEEAQATISALTEQLEAQDASKLQAVLETVKVKVAELIKSNPEVAKEYVAKVQNFLKENADKVKAIVGDNAAVAAAVSAITEVEPQSVVNGLLEQVGSAAEGAKDAAKQKANEAIDNAAQDAKKALGI